LWKAAAVVVLELWSEVVEQKTVLVMEKERD
jgi:hypothetical protein